MFSQNKRFIIIGKLKEMPAAKPYMLVEVG